MNRKMYALYEKHETQTVLVAIFLTEFDANRANRELTGGKGIVKKVEMGWSDWDKVRDQF